MENQPSIKLYNSDCLKILKTFPDNCIDLCVTDPPYLIENTTPGTLSQLSISISNMNDEIYNNNLTNGFDVEVLQEIVRIMKNINIYIWCNCKQIPLYFDFFVKTLNCKFDILIWNKSNATPLFNNKYLSDKEYCLYFRKNGYCQPESYIEAKTVFYQPINYEDKKCYKHPTIKPLNIISTLVKNSSKAGDTILDPFMGSGTTGEACVKLDRKFIGIEIKEDYFLTAKRRIEYANKSNSYIKKCFTI